MIFFDRQAHGPLSTKGKRFRSRHTKKRIQRWNKRMHRRLLSSG